MRSPTNDLVSFGVDPIKGEHSKCCKFYFLGSGFVNEKSHHATDEKVRITMESINMHITPVELYCRHNINLMTFTCYMSLDWNNQETPVQAFARKMPESGVTVIDSQTGE